MDHQTEVNVGGPRMRPVQERSDHTALVVGDFLYVWGGYRSISGEEIFFPSDEICIYDMRSGEWQTRPMEGDIPPSLSGTCGSYLNGSMYIFGGCNDNGHSNQMYCVNLLGEKYIWKNFTEGVESRPTPRDKHSCWVYKDSIIYFGGYGCKQIRDVHPNSFTIDEASWAVIGNALFRFWGWNNEVHVYDPCSNTWTEPHTTGSSPTPRAAHASATLGSRGYVCGGMENMMMDLHYLDLESWTWTNIVSQSAVPQGRSWHTLTAFSPSSLFLFGGLNLFCEPLSDGWVFDLETAEWRQFQHPHQDKPRLWHTACLGLDSDVVIFGGSRDYRMLMDTIAVLRFPSLGHCSDVLIFQTQPYSLLRLCEDCIGKNAEILEKQLSILPLKLLEPIQKRISFFRTAVQTDKKITCT
ncbi:kelch domain-containing protein 1-like isoform X1 [Paramormyrops kingsleyae]|uniref:Kelch domain-containing protein 1-like n=1 Tax=Paramormyrops kingsleyae TaxID=1676925 RepID=A0A3B3T0V3_9TELE|nr:kelch domain-containing protein 1-like isoform X1 [Paramormyrops kingsleyae]